MVKQFTVPCKFGNDMSPVTLYIGNPEASHHPIFFQSDWLSTEKGGVIPQDLMDTLQKLHDLAVQNGANFEELCYYALISATQHSAGNGVSQSEINKYADEFVKKELYSNESINDNNSATSYNNNNIINTEHNTDGGVKNIKANINNVNMNNDNNITNSANNDNDCINTDTVIDMSSDAISGIFNKIATTKNNPIDENSISDDNDAIGNSNQQMATYAQEDEDLLFDDNDNNDIDDNLDSFFDKDEDMLFDENSATTLSNINTNTDINTDSNLNVDTDISLHKDTAEEEKKTTKTFSAYSDDDRDLF